MGSYKTTSRAATAHYIEAMLAELRSMSQTIDSRFLSYLLEMAMIEAADIGRHAGTQNRPSGAFPRHESKASTAEELAMLYMDGQLD